MRLLTLLIIIFAFVVSVRRLPAQEHPSTWEQHEVDSLFSICNQLVSSKPDTVIHLATKLLECSTRKNDENNQGKSHYFLGKGHGLAGNLKQALHHLQEGLKIFQSLSERTYECLTLKEIGTVYINGSEIDKALDFYTRALVLAKEDSNDSEILAITNNIGILFFNKQHYGKAVEYYKEALSLNPEISVKTKVLANLGQALAGDGKLEEGLERCNESISISKTLNDPSYLINSLNAIASIYWRQDKIEEVLKVSLTLLQLLDKTGLKIEKVETLNRIGLSHLNLGNSQKSIPYFRNALALGEEIGYPNTSYIHANLAFAYEATGNFKLAYQEFKIHKKLQDSIQNIQNSKQIEELLAKYETGKKEQQIVLLKHEKQLQNLKLQKQVAELDRQTLIRNTVIAAAFALLIPALVLLIFYKQKMRNKTLLAAKTEEVNKQRTLELIRDHEIKTIKANLAGREKERQRISQELHDGVAGSLAGIKLHLIKVAEEHNQEPMLEKVIKNIDGVYQEVRTISHNLSPIKILNTAFIDLLRNQMKQIAESSTFEIDFICYPEDELNQLPDMIKIEVYRIIQELMANIIRHADATSVEVQFTKTEESINLIIEDTGKGFDASRVSFGLGLNSIKTRVNNISGKLHIDSIPGRGTIVNIDIPFAG